MGAPIEWEKLSPEEKKIQLFLNQKDTLDCFLERNAISKAQYDESLNGLIEKMGLRDQIKNIDELNN